MNIFSSVLVVISGLWLGYEFGLIARDRRQGKGHTGIDRGTRNFNFLAITAGMGGAAILNGVSLFFFPGRWSDAIFWIGIALMLLGFALRIWAVRTLGASFRTTVETHSDQEVVRAGPYRLIRHPSYSGLLLMCAGYGMAVQNWLSLAVAVILPLAALIYRIHVEERALVASLGSEYEEYRLHTKKLIPWLW